VKRFTDALQQFVEKYRMGNYSQSVSPGSISDNLSLPVMICLLGNFRLLRDGVLVPIRAGGKSEALLAYVGIQANRRVARERLVQALWPESDPDLAVNSLYNLISRLHKLLGPALQGAAPIVPEDGYCRLNLTAGIGVDVVFFEALVDAGDRYTQAGEGAASLAAYHRAAELYRDDLCLDADASIIVERERLRARYLSVLAQLAEQLYAAGEYSTALDYLWRLLARDPCREDAYRLMMRCYVRRGQRAAALHHYQVCADLIRAEFDAAPEPATVALFEQIRTQPDQI
jgi:DNA-binding SARP family transcriptional activator